MEKLYTTLFVAASLLFVSLCSFSQGIHWNTAPQKGFVFQITNKEAQRLLTISSSDTIFNGLLHTLIDTFDVKEGWTKRPSKGHFIMAKIIENKLHCEYTSVFPYQVFLLKEYDALSLQVLDIDGNVREDAKVKFKLRRLRLDNESKTYRLENDWFHGKHRIVTVELDGFRSVFNIEKHEVPSWYNDYHNDDGPSFYSYMITDKNRYKPNEKVRFKSYALSQSRFPLRKDLEIWLTTGEKSAKLGVVAPHRPGSYADEFALHDSLKLTLDRSYYLQLREKRGRIVANCTFKYEDYELHGNKLEVRLATDKQFHPSANQLTVIATDVNGLPLKDAKANVLVKTKAIRETFQPLSILPDTLLFTEIDLGPSGTTVLDIPSSLFGMTNTLYDVYVTVNNSQHQRMERVVAAVHYYSQYELTTRFSNDSIIYDLLNNGISMNGVPMTLRYDERTESKKIQLPYKEKINQAVTKVYLHGELISRKINMRDLLPKMKVLGGIEKDSFNIILGNPQRLEVSWYIYQGSELLQKGFGKELAYKTVITDRTQTFYVELLYSFGGEDHILRKDYEFKEDYLNVSLDVPERVYPGQKVDATLHVTDQLGNPVNGVDLTALATTAKLNYYLPDLPYYGNSSTPRTKKAHYTKDDMNKKIALLNLDYKKWRIQARLDTMKYYQFTYPGRVGFTHTVEIEDSTQFAPYVIQNGKAKQVYVIEVNRKPVYYSWVDTPKAYSFYVSPNVENEISLRLHDKVLVMDSIVFEAGKKTILSIDLDNLPENIKIHPFNPEILYRRGRYKALRYSFTSTEIARHTSYIASFRKIQGNTFLESEKEFIPLFNAQWDVYKEKIVAGPISTSRLAYITPSNKTSYQHSGGFVYTFEDNIVYKMDAADIIPKELHSSSFNPMSTINHIVITKKKFFEYKNYSRIGWRTRIIDLVDHASRVKVLLPEEKNSTGIIAFFFENCKTKEIVAPCRNYSSRKAEFYTIPRGYHNVIVIYNNGTYRKMDNISFTSYSNVFIDLNHSALHPPDSLSETWLLKPSSNCYGSDPTPQKIVSFHYTTAIEGNVRGVVYDDVNMPLPGVNIIVKGTMIGTTTDVNGQFSFDVPETPATLVVSFIGYTTKEIEVQINSEITVYMTPDIQQLSEVIVVGYGTMRKSDLTGALSGRVSGVTISHPDRDIEEVEENDVIREAEKQIYQELLTLTGIRSKFSDVGFWEPRLYTDKHGESKFTITFPDDITRWDATVYAMNRRLQTGTVRKKIKSYKPLMAELHVPQFLTQGDSAFFLGKVLNYSEDKNITGKVKWTGAQSDFEKDIQFNDFHTDKLSVHAINTDSITTSYLFTRTDGYVDGEERTVPIVQQGIIRADGTLSIVKNKEEVHIRALPGQTITIEMLSRQLDIYAGEVRYLVDYKYACNEQLASKLLGLIQYKTLMAYEGKRFKYDGDVNKIIARLLKNQNQEFLWSWWDVSPNTSYWMSAHILRALKTAQAAGYNVDLTIENIVRKAQYKFDFLKQYSLYDVDLIHALSLWEAKLNYESYIDKLDSILLEDQISHVINTKRYFANAFLKEKLLLQEIRQVMNLSYQRDSLLRYKKEGIMGDIYFSDNNRPTYWYNNDLAINAIAYRIVKRDSLLKHLLEPMQLYFLSQRKKGTWNTYHASNVLMSVLPDLIADGVSKDHVASVRLAGKINGTIDKFPYQLQLHSDEELTIHKESGLPLYYMQYVQERVIQANTGVEGFEIKTYFPDENNVLEAGKPVPLTVEVEVKKDASAEYVMIEVPIPASCSYADKRQTYNRVETHREYFRERTVIFCENLKTGRYTFTIYLLPRFTGKYMINPAQVSLMYVPVVNANTDMKMVEVK